MAKRKQTYILNYRVIVKPDTYTGGDRRCFTAYCPTLGVADSGDTIEESLRNVKEAIECTLDYLAVIVFGRCWKSIDKVQILLYDDCGGEEKEDKRKKN